MALSQEAFRRFVAEDWSLCLDIGSGGGNHARAFRAAGRECHTLDPFHPADFPVSYQEFKPAEPYEAIWCSHVLEHQPNPHDFLSKIGRDLKDGGLLAITVPPRKDEIVGGHVTLWNPGLLAYNLILAGFDCSEAQFGHYGYNVSVILRKKPIEAFPAIIMDSGDIERLSDFFPRPVSQGFDGWSISKHWA